MDKSRRKQPRLEWLEPRNLLTALPETTAAVVHLDMATTSAPAETTSAPVPLETTAVPLAMTTTSAPVDPTSAPVHLDSMAADATGLPRGARRHDLALNGQVTGTWATHPSNPDVGASQSLTGTGRVQHLGKVNAQGTLHLTGFIASGNATGTLKLTGNGGSVTLDLTGTPQRGFAGPPTSWTYSITGGTGRFARAKGQGSVTLTETSGAFTLNLHAGR